MTPCWEWDVFLAKLEARGGDGRSPGAERPRGAPTRSARAEHYDTMEELMMILVVGVDAFGEMGKI